MIFFLAISKTKPNKNFAAFGLLIFCFKWKIIILGFLGGILQTFKNLQKAGKKNIFHCFDSNEPMLIKLNLKRIFEQKYLNLEEILQTFF